MTNDRKTPKEIAERIADKIHEDAKNREPPPLESKPLGIPTYLDKLLRDSGWDSYVLAVEIGGKGVLHPELGWVEIRTLVEIAEERRND